MPPADGPASAALEAAARQIREAYEGGPIAPLRNVLAPGDLSRAYEVQAINTRFWEASGRRVIGYKVGLTSASLQRRLGVNEPDFGMLFDDMQVPNGSLLMSTRVMQPRVEGEIAVVLGRDLPSITTTTEEAAGAVSFVHPAIEIVGSRIADWAITAADTIADNGSAGAFAIGSGTPLAKLHDLGEARMTLRIDGSIVDEGCGAAAMGNPMEALAWLARTAASRGRPLRAGEVVLTGSLASMVALRPGAFVEAEVTGLGGISFRSGE